MESDITVISDNLRDGVPESTPGAASTSDSNADLATPPAANVSKTLEPASPDMSISTTDQQSTNHYPRRNRKRREWYQVTSYMYRICFGVIRCNHT